MSGGSYNYLYRQEPYNPDDLGAMARALHTHQFPMAAQVTLAWPENVRASAELVSLWKAMEWFHSSDWGFAEVIEAHEAWLKSVDG